MARRGRPARDYKPVVIQVGDFVLHPEHDADLISFFKSVPRGRRVNAIKTALRAGGMQAEGSGVSEDIELTEAAGDFL